MLALEHSQAVCVCQCPDCSQHRRNTHTHTFVLRELHAKPIIDSSIIARMWKIQLQCGFFSMLYHYVPSLMFKSGSQIAVFSDRRQRLEELPLIGPRIWTTQLLIDGSVCDMLWCILSRKNKERKKGWRRKEERKWEESERRKKWFNDLWVGEDSNVKECEDYKWK